METIKKYELRDLTAEDMFPMFNILSKIGIKEFKTLLDSDDVKQAIAGASSGDEADNTVGLAFALDIAGILLANLPKAKNDIYILLSSVAGMTEKEIASLPMSVFAEMVIDLIQKDDFHDFFQAVSKLFK